MLPASAGTDAIALVASAARLRWRAPELTLLLADRASALALTNGEESVRLRAEVLAVFACNQLGRGASAGGRAVRALRAAQAVGAHVTERLARVELAACAVDASAPAIALAELQPVLVGRWRLAPTARAAAMLTAADALAKLGGGPEVPSLLTAADELYDASRAVEPDAVLLRRGVVNGRLAAHHRRVGDHQGAERAAKAGLALLEELSETEHETGQVSGSLTLELVLALLDSGREAEAVLAAQPVLRRSIRPAGAPAACWLRLALASRVHLPAGRYSLARRLLGDAAFIAERNQLDALLAECQQLQAQLHEQCAELPDALGCLRAAQQAERRWRSCAGELRTLLAAEFGTPPSAAELRSVLSAAMGNPAAVGQQGAEHDGSAERAVPAWSRRAVGDIRSGSRSLAGTDRASPMRRRGRHAVIDHERAQSDGPRLASATALPEPIMPAQPSPGPLHDGADWVDDGADWAGELISGAPWATVASDGLAQFVSDARSPVGDSIVSDARSAVADTPLGPIAADALPEPADTDLSLEPAGTDVLSESGGADVTPEPAGTDVPAEPADAHVLLERAGANVPPESSDADTPLEPIGANVSPEPSDADVLPEADVPFESADADTPLERVGVNMSPELAEADVLLEPVGADVPLEPADADAQPGPVGADAPPESTGNGLVIPEWLLAQAVEPAGDERQRRVTADEDAVPLGRKVIVSLSSASDSGPAFNVAPEEFVAPQESLVHAVEALVVDEQAAPVAASGWADDRWVLVEEQVPKPRLRQLEPVEEPEPAKMTESSAPWYEVPDGDQAEPEGIVSEQSPEHQGSPSHQKLSSHESESYQDVAPHQKNVSHLKRRSHLSRRKPDQEDPVSRQKPSAQRRGSGTDAAEVAMGRVLGRHRSDVALADLLAEALVAYQDGRRSELAASSAADAMSSASIEPVTTETERASQPRPEPENEPALRHEPLPQPQPEPEPEHEPVLRHEPQPQPEPRYEPARQPQPEPQRESVLQYEPEPRSGPESVSGYRENRPEHYPSLTRPAGMDDLPTGPIPLNEILNDGRDAFGSPVITRSSLVEFPPDQVWREPGTF